MRLLGACAVLALVACSGCDQSNAPTRPGEPPPRKAASAAPSASAPRVRRSPDGGAPEVPLDPKLRRALTLGPQRVHGQGVAIGKGRVGVLVHDALVVRDTTKLEQVASIPMHDPRALVVTADGSLLAADDVHTVWLLANDQKPRKLSRIVLWSRSMVFPDRGTPDRIWVVAAGGTKLFQYVLAPSKLPLLVSEQWASVDDYDGRLFGSLRDGSFMYSTRVGFRRFFGGTYREDVEGGTRSAFRLLPASRVDTLWLVTSSRAVLYRLVAGKLYELRSLTLSTMGFDADADGEYLAVLELAQPDNAPWTMVLEVFDVDGNRHLREPFTTTESLSSRHWVSELVRNRRLSIRADDEKPLVAVGGPDELHLFRADTGARVAPSPHPEAAKHQ
jgi:hypothetical protein